MANNLVRTIDLNGFPGAPFTEAQVDAAVAELRGLAQWHIAPQVTETVTLDGVWGTLGDVLVLPTLKLVSVSEVRDVTDGGSDVLAGWSTRGNSMLYRAVGWPVHLQSIEVDLTHGHDELPDDLLPVVAQLAQETNSGSAASQKAVGSFSVSYREGMSRASSRALRRHTINLT